MDWDWNWLERFRVCLKSTMVALMQIVQLPELAEVWCGCINLLGTTLDSFQQPCKGSCSQGAVSHSSPPFLSWMVWKDNCSQGKSLFLFQSQISVNCVNCSGMQICPWSRWVRVSEKIRAREPREVALDTQMSLGGSYQALHCTYPAVKLWPQPGLKTFELLDIHLIYYIVPSTSEKWVENNNNWKKK